MAKVQLTEALRTEYQSLFDRCQIKTSKAVEVDQLVSTLIGNKPRYAGIGDPFGIPWSIIAIIHNMECSQDFDEHLHNGDPLTARTIHEPRGRPSSGNPPFTWEDSAADALAFEGLTGWKEWSVPGILYGLEGYNGWGYRLYHPDVKSPYLWGYPFHKGVEKDLTSIPRPASSNGSRVLGCFRKIFRKKKARNAKWRAGFQSSRQHLCETASACRGFSLSIA